MRFGLSEEELDMITGASAKLPEIGQVVLFGSRAKGNYRRGSDVDLALKGDSVTRETVLNLSSDLNEILPLPYFFDVLQYDRIRNAQLVAHIDRVGVVIYEGENSRAKAGKESGTTD